MKSWVVIFIVSSLNFGAWAHDNHTDHRVFSMEPYLQECGGKIYSKCDDTERNQISIYEDARQVAIANHQKILLIVGADWCPPCRILDQMIKEDKQGPYFLKNFVVVEINGELDSTRELESTLDVFFRGFPQASVVTVGETINDDKADNPFFPSSFSSIESLVEFISGEQQPEAPILNYLDQISYLGSASVGLLKKPIVADEGYGRAMFFADPQTDGEKLINFGFAALNVFHYADAFRAFWTADQAEPSVYSKVGLILAAFKNDGYEGTKVAQGFLISLLSMEGLNAREQAWVEFAKAYFVRAYQSPSGIYEDIGEVMSTRDALAGLEAADPQNPEVYSSVRWLLGETNVSVYEKALAIQSDNVGAHHYIMHLYESENRVLDARAKGLIIKDLAPLSAHAVHMYGHTLPQSGLWLEALKQFNTADQIHRNWAIKNNVPPEEDWHYQHNLDLAASVALVLGRAEDAYGIWQNLSRIDAGAWFKVVQLSVASTPPNNFVAQQNMLQYLEAAMSSTPQWNEYLFPLSIETQLNQGNQGTLLPQFSNYAAPGSFGELVLLVLSASSEEQQTNPVISNYFIQKMSEGGFDGWSHSYLELLRLKRVATITQKTATVQMLADVQAKIVSGLLPE